MLETEVQFTFYEICNTGRATIEAEPAINLAKNKMKITKMHGEEIQTKHR